MSFGTLSLKICGSFKTVKTMAFSVRITNKKTNFRKAERFVHKHNTINKYIYIYIRLLFIGFPKDKSDSIPKSKP